MSKQQLDGIHILRVISSFMVVMLHVSADYFGRFADGWNTAAFYNSLTRTAVPVFVMITGYLLMSNRTDTLTFYKKRYLKILIPMIFASFVYHIILAQKPLVEFPKILLSGFTPEAYHLWYMYMLCGLYFVMPFLQKIWSHCSEKEKIFILISWFFLYCVFTTLSSLSLTSYNPAKVFYISITSFWGYAFLGAYLKEKEAGHELFGLILFIFFSALIIFFTIRISNANGKAMETFFVPNSIFVSSASIGVFLFFQNRKLNRARALILKLSDCSYGIYLIHILMIWKVREILPFTLHKIPLLFLIPFYSALVFAASFVAIYLLKKIRFIRILVG